MKLKEIKSANEYLGKEVVKDLYLKNASKNISKYFEIPLEIKDNRIKKY